MKREERAEWEKGGQRKHEQERSREESKKRGNRRPEQVNEEEEKNEQGRKKNTKGCHQSGGKTQQNKVRKQEEETEMKTKSMQSLVLTSPPPAAHPSCIHLDGYRRSWCQTTGR